MSGTGADAGQESLGTELFLNLGVNGSILLAFLNSALGTLGLLFLKLFFLSFAVGKADTVLVGVPFGEGGGVNPYDAVLDKGVGSDQLIIRGVVDDVQDSGFVGGGFGSPVEVSFLKAESSEFIVSSPGADSSDTSSIGDEFSVGDGPGFFEGSFLFVDGHSATGESSLVSGISVDTHGLWLI